MGIICLVIASASSVLSSIMICGGGDDSYGPKFHPVYPYFSGVVHFGEGQAVTKPTKENIPQFNAPLMIIMNDGRGGGSGYGDRDGDEEFGTFYEGWPCW